MGAHDRALHDRILALVEPELELLGLELIEFDVLAGGRRFTLRFAVDKQPPPGESPKELRIGIDECAQASRHIARVLEAAEAEAEREVVPGRYTIEVSSPGIFRRLSKPAHYLRYVGEMVKLTLGEAGGEGKPQQMRARLDSADDEGIEVLEKAGDTLHVPYTRILKAHLDPDLDFGRKDGS